MEQQYLTNYAHFIEQLKHIFQSSDVNDTLTKINNYSDEIKISRGKLFTSLIVNNYLDMFLMCKLKLFSHKSEDTKLISESLFGSEFCLKNILNNQPEEVKKIIWYNLHVLCLLSELLKPENERNQDKINGLNTKLGDNSKQKLQELLGVEVNKETSDMIDDIVKSFEKVLTSQSSGNPFSGIMEISQKISVKYADKINSGEIQLDKLMEAIGKKVPGMENMMEGLLGKNKKKEVKEKVIIDENFSTANVKLGDMKEEKSFDVSKILKMADQFGVIPGGNKPDLGKMMEGLGDTSNIPGLGKMMELMKKLENTHTQEDAEKLKAEMDTFLQNDLGVDMTKLNGQLDEVTKKMTKDV